MNKVYQTVFKDGGKVYYFISSEDYEANTYVIVETEKGQQFAKIINITEKIPTNDLRPILRKATKEDYDTHLKNLQDADKALKKGIDFVNELSLNMKMVSATFTFDRSQLIFNFTADERIDFRELAKKLAYIYHTRIELRQIGARDKAREVGGIGICGKRLCCSNFLNQIETVSMTMAKNQNLALNPNKINGLCGRLLCCLAYEDENYCNSSKGLPRIGSEITTEKGLGTVQNVDVLKRKVTVLINGEKEEIIYDENSKK